MLTAGVLGALLLLCLSSETSDLAGQMYSIVNLSVQLSCLLYTMLVAMAKGRRVLEGLTFKLNALAWKWHA